MSQNVMQVLVSSKTWNEANKGDSIRKEGDGIPL